MITKEQKQKIITALAQNEGKYPSASKFANVLGINPAQLSRIKKGEIDGVLADSKWVTLARKLNVELGKRVEMVAAKTPVFQFITTQLENCQANAVSGLLCDAADIGKTFTAKHYARTHKNAIFIDCSQTKTKQKLIRAMANEFGLNNSGRYVDVYDDLIFYLKTLINPLVILDEAGDLDYGAWLELKALWNATEYACGWYMMGADGLKAKMEGNIGRRKVGYAEIFSRFGNRYQRVTPEGDTTEKMFAKKQTQLIAKANGVEDIQKLFALTGGSLRRIYIEIQKLKASA